jgi:hypothetical protein
MRSFCCANQFAPTVTAGRERSEAFERYQKSVFNSPDTAFAGMTLEALHPAGRAQTGK